MTQLVCPQEKKKKDNDKTITKIESGKVSEILSMYVTLIVFLSDHTYRKIYVSDIHKLDHKALIVVFLIILVSVE